MDTALGLILLSGVMLIGSFSAGLIPMAMHMSEDKMHFVSVLGAGLLIGCALTVIIPEGIHTLYLAQMNQQSHTRDSFVAPHEKGPNSDSPVPDARAHEHTHVPEADPFASVGLALVLGFCFMLLIDQCSRSSSNSSRDIESHGTSATKKTFTVTLGLVVHAAADGIALGASALSSHSDVELIVFMAIMLHKAPAAFGLVTFLLQSGLDRSKVRRDLAIFSLAAPVMAIITYFGISQEGKETMSNMNATAIAMLFSAGTFLYVSTVHVLPEVTKDSQNGFSRKELVALVGGALLPLLLTSGHHH